MKTMQVFLPFFLRKIKQKDRALNNRCTILIFDYCNQLVILFENAFRKKNETRKHDPFFGGISQRKCSSEAYEKKLSFLAFDHCTKWRSLFNETLFSSLSISVAYVETTGMVARLDLSI